MNTLQERLDRNGYTAGMKELEGDKRLIETVKRDYQLRGAELPEEIRDFEESVRNVEAARAGEYESTVAVVDSRNDLEFLVLEMAERLELAAEECEKTDPEKAAKIRSLFGDLG